MDDTAVDERNPTMRDDLGSALGKLPTPQRKVLSLRYLAGLDDREISEALGISVRAVTKHAQRGDAALRARRSGGLVLR